MALKCTQGTSNCGGLITGNLVVNHKGNLDVHAHDMGVTMRMTFKEPGMFGKRGSKHEVNVDVHLNRVPAMGGTHQTYQGPL